ncbi:DUF397 domain-containing protein [Actinomadura pelletieri]|uniref:DUF397 domain-containing protein n=1 Tax=Actinomadura pelletieri TaxID=111805 RepID=UPI000EB3CF04
MNEKFTAWRVSSHSQPGANCVEAGRSLAATVGVRDSTLRNEGPILEFTRTEWAALLTAIRSFS